jgi:hypothetical protein
MEPAEYDEMLRRIMALTVTLSTAIDRQGAVIEELRDFTRQQAALNERLTQAIEHLDVTQARIETLLTRVLRPDDNGRVAPH